MSARRNRGGSQEAARSGREARSHDPNRASDGRTSPWWRYHFDDVYFELHGPMFPEAESRREVAAMLEMLGLPTGSRVLDVPCGWGRHTALLRLAGLDTFGADISVSFLHRAAALAGASEDQTAIADVAADSGEEAQARAPFAAADIRALPFRTGSFDGAVDVFTSVGLFEHAQDDIAALAEVRRVLVAGGRLLLETMHRDDVLANYLDRDTWVLPDGTEVSVRRRYDRNTHVSREVMRWQRAAPDVRSPQRGEKRHMLRLYSAAEVMAVLEEAGFEVVSAYGDWSGTRFTRRSGTLIVIAKAA